MNKIPTPTLIGLCLSTAVYIIWGVIAQHLFSVWSGDAEVSLGLIILFISNILLSILSENLLHRK